MSEVSVSRACGEGIGDAIAAVPRTHSFCLWALVVLGARVWQVRVWGSETDRLRFEGVVVEM